MDWIQETRILTHQGALTMLLAAVAEADAMGQPQCIVIVDASGEVVIELRMTGAKFLSRKSALSKALTAASIGAPSATVPEPVRSAIAAATAGAVTGLSGGMPIIVDGYRLGGIGVGSGSKDQDEAVARAALVAIAADV